jgi:hypothetical protein
MNAGFQKETHIIMKITDYHTRNYCLQHVATVPAPRKRCHRLLTTALQIVEMIVVVLVID